MGVAAFNRGSKAIREHIAAGDRPAAFVFMEHLNSLEKCPDAGTPFSNIQFVFGHKVWWAECPTTGYGYCYLSLREAVRRWKVQVVGYRDGMWIAEPIRAR